MLHVEVAWYGFDDRGRRVEILGGLPGNFVPAR